MQDPANAARSGMLVLNERSGVWQPGLDEIDRTIIRLQEVMRPRGERQFARRHVRHDLVVRGASDPFVAGQATTHSLVPSRPAQPRPHRRILDAGDFPG